MKRIFLTYSLLIISKFLIAQGGNAIFSQCKEMKTIGINVVLSDADDSLYNANLKNTITKYWNFSPVEFISDFDFKKEFRTSRKKYYLLKAELLGQKELSKSMLLQRILIRGGVPLESIRSTDYLAFSAIQDSIDIEEKFMINHIQFIQNFLRFVYEMGTEEYSGRVYKNHYSLYADKRLKKFRLLIDSNHIKSGSLQERFSELYPYPYTLLKDHQELYQAIEDQSSELAYTMIAYWPGAGMMIYIIEAKGGNIMAILPAGFNNNLTGDSLYQLKRKLNDKKYLDN